MRTAGVSERKPWRMIDGDLLAFDRIALRVVALDADDDADDREGGQQEEARDDAGHEELADRDAADDARRHDRVEDQVVARGHDDALDGRGDRHADRVLGRVAFLHHDRDHDRADGRGVGDGGAGEVPEEHAGHRVDDGKPAGEPADEDVGEVHDPVGEAAGPEQLPRQDEEGDREEGKGVDALDRLLRNHHDGHVEIPERGDGGEDQDQGNGEPQQEEPDKGAAEDPDGGGITRHRV